MRVSREKAAEHRERMLTTASRLFRERGFEGIGVDALAEAAGLTYGSVYSGFGSKEALAAEAVARSFADSVNGWTRIGERALARGDNPFAAIVDRYLTERHRDQPGGGCALAALGGEAPRSGETVRAALAEGTAGLIAVLARFAPGGTEAERREIALAAMSAMIGGILVARAAGNSELSRAALASARSAALGVAARRRARSERRA